MANYTLQQSKNFSVLSKRNCVVSSNNRLTKTILQPYFPLLLKGGRCYRITWQCQNKLLERLQKWQNIKDCSNWRMALCCDSKTAPEEDEEEDMDGPLEDRSCTDIIFLLFFAAFLVGMVSRDIQTRETRTIIWNLTTFCDSSKTDICCVVQ